jgi:hypothetical protein
MARNLAALMLVAATGSTAWAQDPVLDLSLLTSGPKEGETITVPMIPMPEFGLRAGYLKQRDADDGVWFGGVQVRVPLTEVFTVEGSIEFHSSEFNNGDIEVIQYPVQATLLLFPIPSAPAVSPYVLGGLGWYYTTVDFSGSLSGVSSDTESIFGAHLGFGARVRLGGTTTLSADLRYIFLEPDDDQLDNEEFDTIQLALALSFPF